MAKRDTTQDATPKAVPVKLPPDLVARIDAIRGYLPREPFVRDLIDKALKRIEAGGEQ